MPGLHSGPLLSLVRNGSDRSRTGQVALAVGRYPLREPLRYFSGRPALRRPE